MTFFSFTEKDAKIEPPARAALACRSVAILDDNAATRADWFARVEVCRASAANPMT